MGKEDRQRVILRDVRLHNRVLLNDLAIVLDVSRDTVRRDIIELDKQKKLTRIHGGAQTLGYKAYNYHTHEIYLHSEKMMIAEKENPTPSVDKPSTIKVIPTSQI